MMSDFRQQRKWFARIGIALFVLILIVLACVRVYLYMRYHTQKSMTLAVKEYTPQTYPDNPAPLSVHHGKYSHPKVRIQHHQNNQFDLIFLPGNQESAKIFFKNINAGLMTPSVPEWVKNDENLTRIALTDRQWNRQQVIFKSPDFEVIGGDGIEKHLIYEAHLAKNCLNAGFWEILLFSKKNNKKELVYQGWFTFPLGYYKAIFEHNTGFSYWRHASYLESWITPEGLELDLNQLRTVTRTYPLVLTQDIDEPIALDGEQVNKHKNIISNHSLNQFKDYMNNEVAFSTFIPPGIYQKNKPWKHEYWRIDHPISAVLQVVRTTAKPNQDLYELVIVYSDDEPNQNNDSYFYVSGFDIKKLPRLDPKQYAKGKLFLMGVGTPPLKQTYTALLKNPPESDPIFSVFLNEKDEWINHHEAAIDGAILFIDKYKKNRLHMYVVSYERHAVVAHYIITLPEDFLRRERQAS